MSVNSSLSEQLEDGAGELQDLYNRELSRKKNPSQSFQANNEIEGSVAGGYRDWKLQNGFDSSGRMVSSLGRALHNQGIVPHSEENYSPVHYHNAPSSPSNPDYRVRDQYNMTVNSSQPRIHPMRSSLRQDNQSRQRTETVHFDEGYSYPVRHEDNQFEGGCNNQCCSNNYRSPAVSPKAFQNETSQREKSNQNRNHANSLPNGYHCRNVEVHQPEPERSQRCDQNPCRPPDTYQPVHCQGFRACQPPPTCHGCQHSKEVSSRPESPRKNNNRKTEASIKKLYRILWLQNEQLGLLERQVSKLIEMNFQKESIEHPAAQIDKSESTDASVLNKPETKEIGIMTDLPCPQCISNQDKHVSSDSDIDDAKKSAADESLTLNGAEIPVNRCEPGSPPVSMHIDLQDFQETSSSETEESDTSEDETESVGWTFYDNVVGQVNNMLKSSGNKKKKKKPVYKDEINFPLHQLKRLGLDQDSNNAKRVTFEEGLREQQGNLRAQSEVSMNFNALAAKYLTSSVGKVQDISLCNVISSSTNMSLATMRYLERHHISNRDPVDTIPRKSSHIKKKNRTGGDQALSNKFLDITAIRQQPKLLPKNI